MKKLLGSFLIIVMVASICLGCGKSEGKDIEKRTIVLSVGYDLADDGNYIVTLQALKSQVKTDKGSNASAQSSSDVVIYSSMGRTINEAFDVISEKLGKPPYFSHEKFIIIGERLARSGIELVIDSNLRGRETRPNVPIFVCRNYAYEYIKAKGLDESIPADELIGIMEIQAEKGFSFLTSPVQMYNSISQKDGYNITGIVSFEKKKVEGIANGIFNVSGSAIFKKDKLVAFLDGQETKVIALIKNKVRTGDFTIQLPDNLNQVITLEIANAKRKMKPVLNDNRISMELTIKIESNIAETNFRVNPKKDPKVINEIEQLENKEVKKQIQAVLYKIRKEYKMDVIGFGSVIKKNHPKEWNKVQENWEEVFSEMAVDVTVESHIELTGSIMKPAY